MFCAACSRLSLPWTCLCLWYFAIYCRMFRFINPKETVVAKCGANGKELAWQSPSDTCHDADPENSQGQS
jgi:hypothetical protein